MMDAGFDVLMVKMIAVLMVFAAFVWVATLPEDDE